IALCGLVSTYQDGAPQAYDNLMQIVYKTARMQGFLVSDYFHRIPEMVPELERMVLHDQLTYRLDYWQGLESAVDAMNALATGKNSGMGLVQISELP
ncbi:MAG: NADP-dependent oxidoreductase, partial [Algiphilus sp.]